MAASDRNYELCLNNLKSAENTELLLSFIILILSPLGLCWAGGSRTTRPTLDTPPDTQSTVSCHVMSCHKYPKIVRCGARSTDKDNIFTNNEQINEYEHIFIYIPYIYQFKTLDQQYAQYCSFGIYITI
jgi:hypothetical protein